MRFYVQSGDPRGLAPPGLNIRNLSSAWPHSTQRQRVNPVGVFEPGAIVKSLHCPQNPGRVANIRWARSRSRAMARKRNSDIEAPPLYGHQIAKAMSHIGLGSGANERANNSAAHRVTHATSHRVIRRMFIPLVGHFTAFPVKRESAPADLSALSSHGGAAARSHLTPESGSGRFNSTGSPDCAEPCCARYRVRAAVPPQEGAAGCRYSLSKNSVRAWQPVAGLHQDVRRLDR